LDGDVWLSGLIDNLVGKIFGISLDFLVSELSSDKSLDNVDGSLWVLDSLVLGGFSDELLLISESNLGWGNSVSEFVWNDFDSSVLENTYARVGGSEIDTDDWAFDLLLFVCRHHASEDGNDQQQRFEHIVSSHVLV
jgi:hypothetical protein